MGAFTCLNYHIIFGTRFRARLIQESFQEDLYKYIGGIVRGLDGSLTEIGGVEDHLHLLASLSPTKALSEVVRDIKANSSKWVNDHGRTPGRFEWQKGYSAFTVSYSNAPVVRHYIQSQHEHHRVKTFQEEYIEFLQRHNIEFDPRFLFEGEFHG
jgi:putative transposase